MGDVVQKMLETSLGALKSDDEVMCSSLDRLDDKVDTLEGAIKLYLSRLDHALLDVPGLRQADAILDYAINLEHVGDIIEGSLARMTFSSSCSSLPTGWPRSRPSISIRWKTCNWPRIREGQLDVSDQLRHRMTWGLRRRWPTPQVAEPCRTVREDFSWPTKKQIKSGLLIHPPGLPKFSISITYG